MLLRRLHFLVQSTSAVVLLLSSLSVSAMEVPIDDFPLGSYSQNINDFLPPHTSDYKPPLLREAYQKRQLQRFYDHYYGNLSPWSEDLVRSILPMVKKIELETLESFNNQNKVPLERHYSENFKEQSQSWWSKIKQNM